VRYCSAALAKETEPLRSPLVAKLLVLSLVQLCAPQQSARLEANSALRFLKTQCGVVLPDPPPSPPQHEALQRASAIRLSLYDRCSVSLFFSVLLLAVTSVFLFA
jgi:hypothetical protein